MSADNRTPHINLDARCRNFRGKLVVALDGNAIELDEVGAAIFKWIDGSSTVEMLADRVAADYDVTREQARDDCAEFVTALADLGVVRIDPQS